MRKLLLLSFFIAFISCNENAERADTPYSNNDSKINSLFGEVDTASPGNSTSKIIVEPTGLRIVKENKDTFVSVYSRVEKTFTYYESTLDTFTLKYNGSVKPTDPEPPKPDPGNYGTLTYSNNYDKASDINSNQLGRGSISAFSLTGSGSFRTEVRGSDPSISSGYRSEQQYEGDKFAPVEGVTEYDVYYENWGSVSGGGHSVQWHPYGDGSAVLSLQNYGGKFNVVRSLNGTNYHQSGTLMTTQPNKWYKMRWEIKWSKNKDGYIRLFIDGSQYYSFTGKTCDGVPYFKLGQNRWNMRSGDNTIVYYDNLRIWKR